MYADRVETAAKASIKDRLNGDSTEASGRRRQVTGKRQRPDDDKWEHDLYEDSRPQISSMDSLVGRVESLEGGIEFLELCGFERIERDGDEFLFLPRDKEDMTVLNSAGSVLNSAITNPYFGLFSKE